MTCLIQKDQNTTILFRGISTVISLRLWVRAPRTMIFSPPLALFGESFVIYICGRPKSDAWGYVPAILHLYGEYGNHHDLMWKSGSTALGEPFKWLYVAIL